MDGCTTSTQQVDLFSNTNFETVQGTPDGAPSMSDTSDSTDRRQRPSVGEPGPDVKGLVNVGPGRCSLGWHSSSSLLTDGGISFGRRE